MLFNSETRKLEAFTPRVKWEVTLYTCGPTVYDRAHIGNFRAFFFADILKRTLLYSSYNVKHTMNFTDFGCLTSDADTGEDKMMKGLRREGMDVTLQNMRKLADKYIKAFKEDASFMEIIPPEQYARASDYVKEQIELIKTLQEKGFTYETSGGVYFDISKFPTYGRLGSIDLEKLKEGARVEVNAEKKHPADFAVWKKGDLGWESPWSKGFPGWHIECSAMALETLGKQIDIHTGGVDLAPTHHNAEIAQSECATGKQFVRYWMHSEHIQVNSEKMAKSEGTGLTLKDLFDAGYTALDYRYWLLTSHYRTKANFTYEALDGAKAALLRLRRFVFEECTDYHGEVNETYRTRFLSAINNDIDTPKALAILWELMKDDTVSDVDKRATILEMDGVFGLALDKDIDEGLDDLGHIAIDDLPEEIQSIVEERLAARVAQNWEEADRLREALLVKGYLIEDTGEGPKISKK